MADLKRPPAITARALRTCITMTKPRLIWLSHWRHNLLRNSLFRSVLGRSLPQFQYRPTHPGGHSQTGDADASLARQVQCLTCGSALVALQVVLKHLHDLGITVLRC